MRITKINPVKSYGRIASGKKINRAADNAAGMAIVSKLKANANGLNVATQNTREGINVTQIADGGYDSIMDRLQRACSKGNERHKQRVRQADYPK